MLPKLKTMKIGQRRSVIRKGIKDILTEIDRELCKIIKLAPVEKAGYVSGSGFLL